ncbi:hypothetical protein BPUTSESOX_479 [uncultured Gammaproteobacteria bacterium]|nr:hypothetical protein BPUTSESOX_479 [uncultured Gammaproteobacteria bacterium]
MVGGFGVLCSGLFLVVLWVFIFNSLIKSSFVDLDGWKNGWFWFVWNGFLRGD